MKSFWVSVWCGANRFLHTEVTRQDAVIRRIFGWRRVCGQDTYKRFFHKFTQGLNQRVFTLMYQWFFQGIRFDNYTLDLDSSVLTRYGDQEGAERGYNPTKRGRKLHHPLMAFIADCRMVANLWLRSGSSHTANNLSGFVEDTFEKLRGKKIGLLRRDSGFYGEKIFRYLEGRDEPISYIIAARLYKPVQLKIAGQKAWLTLDTGVDIGETEYSGMDGQKLRRMIIVRQHVQERPKAAGMQLRLFQGSDIYNNYRYHCFITNLTLPAQQVWNLYRHRADAENRIKELKNDFGFDSFNMQSFYGTEAALNMVMMAYNLMSLFRQVIMESKVQPKLSTLRYRLFAIGAYMVKEGNSRILKLSLAMKRRAWFLGLWGKASQ
ncbi:MAG TPA: IS1380 family transposase, partial [Syntrophales bacterium]|nr:IS1380 family transposase [Syntrophales bacterium]